METNDNSVDRQNKQKSQVQLLQPILERSFEDGLGTESLNNQVQKIQLLSPVSNQQNNKKKNFAFITEGNEAQNPNVGQSERSHDEIEKISLNEQNLLNQRLNSEFEPNGSQNFQYNGHFVPFIPPTREPAPQVQQNEGANRALQQIQNQQQSQIQIPIQNQPVQRSWIPYLDFTRQLMVKYDAPFIILLGVQNLNHGLWSVAVLACQDLFKQYLKLNPGQMTLYMSIIHIPWSVKIIYGIVSDNLPIAGTRRKSYIVIMGFVQFLALISIYFLHETSALLVAIFLTMAALSEAFVNVVADAIMCVQARKDPNNGSQDLIAFSWMASGVGGILGCLSGGVMTQYFHPRYSFLCYSFFGIIVAIIGSQLTKECEEDQDSNQSDQSQEEINISQGQQAIINQNQEQQEQNQNSKFCKKIQKNFKQIGMAIMMPEIYMVVFFFVLNGIISPDFGDFSYYFMLNVIKISKFQYSMLGTIGQVTGIIGTIYYENYLKNIEVRTVLFWSTIISCFSAFCQYAFAVRWNLYMGINDLVFIICTDTIFGVISLAMNTLPTLALFAKITPTKIEGTVFAFLTGTTNLANNVLSPMIGVWINDKFVGVTADDLSQYKKLCFISFVCCFFGFLLLPLIPTKSDILFYQNKRVEEKLLKQKIKMNEQNQKDDEKTNAIIQQQIIQDDKIGQIKNNENIEDLKSTDSSKNIKHNDEEREPLILKH